MKNIKKYIAGTILFLFLIISIVNKIVVFDSWLQYFDELYALIFFPLIAISVLLNKKIKVNKYLLLMGVFVFVFALTGIIGNILNDYQTFKYALVDLFINLKFFFGIGSTLVLMNLMGINCFSAGFQKKIIILLKIVTVAFAFLVALEYLFDIFNRDSEIRYGIKSISLFYTHQTYFAASMAVLALLIMLFSIKKTDYLYAILCMFLSLFTLRTKTIMYLPTIGGIALILNWKMIPKKYKNALYVIAPIAVATALYIGYDTLYFYFVEKTLSARNLLTKTSFIIANKHFPFGSGFGTFGSYISGVNYSEIYYIYNLNSSDGMTPSNYSYLTDTFWPMLIGQNGYLGTLAYLCSIVLITVLIFKIKNSKYKFVGLSAVAYLLISSTSETAFVNPLYLGFAIIIGLVLYLGFYGCCNNEKSNN